MGRAVIHLPPPAPIRGGKMNLIAVAVVIAGFAVGFMAGRSYERKRLKWVGKPIKTQDVLGVFTYDKRGKN